MKTRFTFFILFFLLVSDGFSQELPGFSQYIFNRVLLNPAAVGCVDYCILESNARLKKKRSTQNKCAINYNYTSFVLTDRHQWLNLGEGPKTQTFIFEQRIADVGYAVLLYNDVNGAISRRGGALAYSYRIIKKRKESSPQVTLGAQLSEYQYKINTSGMFSTPELLNDPALLGISEPLMITDASAGIYVYSNSYFFSLSMAQILQPTIKLKGTYSQAFNLPMHAFLGGGYRSKMNRFWDVEVSSVLKSTIDMKMQADLNARFMYDRFYWAGFSFRKNFVSGNIFQAMMGFRVNKAQIGYAYEYPIGGVAGSHELTLSVILCQDRIVSSGGKKAIVPCPGF